MPLSFQTVDNYRTFGSCVSLSNGLIEALVTVGRGPRVIHFGMCGGPNLFWTDDEGAALYRSADLQEAFGRGDTYEFMGGHRLWASPEHPVDTYYPDNEAVQCEQTPFGWVITAPPQEALGLQFQIELRMSEDSPVVSVRHRITNVSQHKNIILAPWAITQLAPGGTLLFPQSKQETGLLADRHFSIWPYTDMGDHRLGWFDDYITLRQDKTERPLKIGTHNLAGWALYQNLGYLFKKEWAPLPGGQYPDSGCSFEIYTNANFLEMETLGVLQSLPSGRSAIHEEIWSCAALPELQEPAALYAEHIIPRH